MEAARPNFLPEPPANYVRDPHAFIFRTPMRLFSGTPGPDPQGMYPSGPPRKIPPDPRAKRNFRRKWRKDLQPQRYALGKRIVAGRRQYKYIGMCVEGKGISHEYTHVLDCYLLYGDMAYMMNYIHRLLQYNTLIKIIGMFLVICLAPFRVTTNCKHIHI